MVHWQAAERAHINKVFSSIKPTLVTAKALARLFFVYPWTKKYFKFEEQFNYDDEKVKIHAEKVVSALNKAIGNLDDVKSEFSKLSRDHAETFKVDPENFKLLSSCLLIELAQTLQKDFTPEVHASFNKFLNVVVDALSKEYH
uniref:hemoglobin subunit beta-like n=1 Tax=Pristiophorus japonicus TaxID=55135 RepID=UPI00398E9039